MDVYQFSSSWTPTGITGSMLCSFQHVSAIFLTFPTNAFEITVLKNPCVEALQLTFMGRNFPERAMITIGDGHFTVLQTLETDLEFLPRSDEFLRSMTMPRSDGNILLKPLADATSCLIGIKLERWSSDPAHDGIDSAGANINVRLVAHPMFPDTGTRHSDPYLNAKLPSALNLPPPVFYFLSDTSMMFRITDRGSECIVVKHNMGEVLEQFASGAPVA
jgi:hypothetical protein